MIKESDAELKCASKLAKLRKEYDEKYSAKFPLKVGENIRQPTSSELKAHEKLFKAIKDTEKSLAEMKKRNRNSKSC